MFSTVVPFNYCSELDHFFCETGRFLEYYNFIWLDEAPGNKGLMGMPVVVFDRVRPHGKSFQCGYGS